MAKRILSTTLFVWLAWYAFGRAAAPQVFFSDLTDGPVSGWEGSASKGAAVTIWGLNWGDSTRAATSWIECGGQTLDNDSHYAEWSVHYQPQTAQDSVDGYTTARGLRMTTFWLNSSMNTGNTYITVVTNEGRDSVPFYTRNTGTIYFADTSGNDSYNGLYDTFQGGSDGPWENVYKARGTLDAGDVCYFREGSYTTGDEGDYMFYFYHAGGTGKAGGGHNNGTWGNSIAIASYPGEIAELGDGTGGFILREAYSGGGGQYDTLLYWTFSRMRWYCGYCCQWQRNSPSKPYGPPLVSLDRNTRFIGLDIQNPYSGWGGGLYVRGGGGQESLFVYGCHIHDLRANNRGSSAGEAYGMYLEGYGNHKWVDIGWNEITNNPGSGSKGMQIYGHLTHEDEWIDEVQVHDNLIYNHQEAGIQMGSGDGAEVYEFLRRGYIYNNIILDCGEGIRAFGDMPGTHKGAMHIWNNVFYGNSIGIRLWAGYGDPPDTMEIKNNVFYGGTYYQEDYWDSSFDDSTDAENNCYYDGSSVPYWDSLSIEANPQFSNPNSWNFHLQSNSPCIDSGLTVPVAVQDYDGIARPYGSAYDIGGYEYLGGDATPPDQPDFFYAESLCSDPDSTQFSWSGIDSSDLDSVIIRSSGTSCPTSKVAGSAVFDGGGFPNDTVTVAISITETDTLYFSFFGGDEADNWSAYVCDTVIYTAGTSPLVKYLPIRK